MTDAREHILKTAFSLFVKKSYKDVTLNELEKATGLTKGAFYHYFKNKEEIFCEVIDHYYFASKFSNIEMNIAENETLRFFSDAVYKHIHDLMYQIVELFDNQTPDPFFLSLVLEARRYYPGFDSKARETQQLQLTRWINVLSKAQLSDEIRRDINIHTLAQNYLALGMSIIHTVMYEGSVENALFLLKNQFHQMYQLVKS